MKKKFDKETIEDLRKLRKEDRLYGTATIGDRGQVVIPAEARKDMGLRPGDQLVVVGSKFSKALTFMKADNLTELMNLVLSRMAGTGLEEDIRDQFKKIIDSLQK